MDNKNELGKTTPINNANELNSEFQIATTEDMLKTDGSIILGVRNPDNSYTIANNTMPDNIDIEQRKKERKELINAQKKKAMVNRNITKEAKRVQTIVAVVVFLLFVAVGGFFFYHKYYANNKDFTLKNVYVEFGQPTSLKIADYVNVSNPDEKKFILDLSAVAPDKIGKYTYKVTYSGITKSGQLEIADKSAPEIVLQEAKLNVGDTYTPETFIHECKDFSGCIYMFEDGSSIKTATTIGRSTVNIIVKDKIGNQITKEATLNVKSTDIILSCEKDYGYDYSLGYKTIETYDIYFAKDYSYKNTILKTSNIYVDHNVYLNYKENNSKASYVYDDNLSKVTKQESYTLGFNGNNTLAEISSYLQNNAYSCKTKLAE